MIDGGAQAGQGCHAVHDHLCAVFLIGPVPFDGGKVIVDRIDGDAGSRVVQDPDEGSDVVRMGMSDQPDVHMAAPLPQDLFQMLCVSGKTAVDHDVLSALRGDQEAFVLARLPACDQHQLTAAEQRIRDNLRCCGTGCSRPLDCSRGSSCRRGRGFRRHSCRRGSGRRDRRSGCRCRSVSRSSCRSGGRGDLSRLRGTFRRRGSAHLRGNRLRCSRTGRPHDAVVRVDRQSHQTGRKDRAQDHFSKMLHAFSSWYRDHHLPGNSPFPGSSSAREFTNSDIIFRPGIR